MEKALERDRQPTAQWPPLPTKLKKDVQQPNVLPDFTNKQTCRAELGKKNSYLIIFFLGWRESTGSNSNSHRTTGP